MSSKLFHQVDLSNKKFLVSGGAGFIGSNIVSYLLDNGAQQVLAYDNLSTGSKKNIEPFLNHSNFKFIEGDIADFDSVKNALQGIDYVSHQAALGSVPRSIKNPIATNKANVDGFLNVITAARENGVKRTVFASSSSVYGDSKNLPKIEAEIGKPLSPYAVSKLTNELYANVVYDNYSQEIIGLRYFNVFGPHQSPEGAYAAVIPLFIKALINDQPPNIDGDGLQTRDFTYVDNAVEANIKALFTDNKNALGNNFNVALGERYSLMEVYELLSSILNKDIKPNHRENRQGDIRDSLADISRSRDLLGYNPSIKLKEGLERTVKWFAENDAL